MNKELMEMMRSVLKEELEPVKIDIKTLKSEQEKTNEQLTNFESKLTIGFEELKSSIEANDRQGAVISWRNQCILKND